MAAALSCPPVATPPARVEDQRLVLRNVSWKEYVLLSDVLSDRPGLHLTYLEGTLEIMTTSPAHENTKKVIARLLELYALLTGIRIAGFGSATYRREEKERGLEPDECYCVGEVKPFPDLAIEVVLTSGGVSKLAVYAGLGVREVWFWEDGAFEVYELGPTGYARNEKSALFPSLDFAHLATFVARKGHQDDVVRAYWEELRAQR